MSLKDLKKNLKINLKARLRVPILLKSDNLKIKNYNLLTILELKNKTFSKNTNNEHINNYLKYTEKTNLIKFVMTKLPIRDIYEHEKECSMICDNVGRKIKKYIDSHNPDKKKFPKIEKKKLNISAKFINTLNLKKIDSTIEKNKKYSSSKKIHYNYFPISLKRKNICNNRNDNLKINISSNIKKDKKDLINNFFISNNNFTIIKGGGIKYNNSIFRYKNINQLI